MRIEEDIGTIIHKDIMDIQTNNAKTTNVDTTGPQDQTKRHYIIKGGLDNNTHNISNITNRGSVMDVIDLTNQDMDVDSQIVSEEENEDREIRYRNNKNNYNTNKKIDNKNNPKKYNKKNIVKKRQENSKNFNKKSEKAITTGKTKNETSTLNICTFNARGINDTKKQELISQLIQTEEWDIASINETKLMTRKREFAFNNIKKEFRSIVNSTNDTNSKGGQITLIKDKLDHHVINIEFIQGYCTKLDLIFKKNSKQKNILLIMVYMPNDDKKIKDSIIQQTKIWIENAYRKEQDIIVMGDFNESDKHKDKDNKFVRMLKKSELIDVHKFFFENDVRTTWSNGNTSSRIDYIFSTENLMNNIIQHEVIQGVQIKTDHNIITIKISINDIIIKNNRFLKKDSIVSDIEKSLKSKYINSKNFTNEDWAFLAEKLESDVNESIEFLLDDQQNKDIAWEFIINSFQTNKNKLIEDKTKEKRLNDIMEEKEQYILEYNNKRNDVIILKKIVKIIKITKKRVNKRMVKKQVRDINISDRRCTIKKNHVIIQNWNCKGVGK
ncbi:DNase I-like protein [Rhizophagus irregularis]|uniref:DNase I-like protein n=1 Tax=Rhizophagus irregularis TaxID=588596 RepID=A0A2N1MJV3_9GLOM|nr:DNase I-like protein [Rhizophagus irregularis]